MKTHFAEVERGNESDPTDYWDEIGLCGIYSEDLENDWELVTCKKCLNKQEEYLKQKERDLEIQNEEYGRMADFFKKEQEINKV